jgi:hypothetical protein
MHLPRMDTIKTPNWRFLHLVSLSLLARMAAMEVPVTIKSMAARLRPLTQYPRTQHSLDSHAETKTATRYFLYPSRCHRQILRASRKDRQHHALQQAACQSEVSNQRIHEANLRLHDSDGTQRQARQDDKHIITSLPPLRIPRLLAILFPSVRAAKYLSAQKPSVQKPSALGTLHSLHHCDLR